MITTPLLEEIYQIQRQLDEDAQSDIKKYIENAQQTVLAVERQYGVKFKYGNRQSYMFEPLVRG